MRAAKMLRRIRNNAARQLRSIADRLAPPPQIIDRARVAQGSYLQPRYDLQFTHGDRKADAERFWREVDAGTIPGPPQRPR